MERGASPWLVVEDRASPRGSQHAASRALPPASARAPRPAHPFTAQGAARHGFASGRLSSHKGCPLLLVSGRWETRVRDQLIPGLEASSGDGVDHCAVLKSSRAASDCSCGSVPHPFLMQLKESSGRLQ